MAPSGDRRWNNGLVGLFSRRKNAPTGDSARAETEREPDADGARTDGSGPSPTEDFVMLLNREWDRLASPGTWWGGAERLAIAADARCAVAAEPLSGFLPAPVEEATRRIAVDAAGIRGTDVARWELEGLDSFAYIEIVGIVSRLVGLDVAAFGLGRKLRPLPEPEPGEPSQHRPDGAAITTGWAPTIGPASASSALAAVPPEAEAMADIHGVLYMPMDQMSEMHIEREGLSRSQIELTAARTSILNDCFHCLLGHASMLRTSINSHDLRLTAAPIVSGFGDTAVLHGAEIIAFVDSIVLHDEDEYDEARPALEACIGEAATDRVALVAGNFSMMSRALDAVGAPVDRDHHDLAAELGVSIPDHLATV